MAIDYGDMFNRYATARLDRAMQPFEDPEGYFNNRMDQRFGATEEGNTKPLSTTITYNDDGSQTVTNKHEVGPSEAAPQATPAVQAAPAYTAPVAQPVQQPQPVVAAQPVAPTTTATPAAQDIEEQRRRQIQLAQLAQAQAQQNAAPAQTPMPAQGPQSQPTAGAGPEVGQAPVQAVAPVAPAASAQPAAPVNPAVPMPNIGQVPTPGPGVQVAAAPGAAPTLPPAPKPQWQTDLDTAQGDATKLAAFVGNPNNPEEARKLASEKWQQLLTKTKEEEKGNKILLAAAQGDPKATNDLARHLKSRTEEGSYLKAILFARLGLTDLAKEEQAKLSQGGLESTMLGGSHYTVERNRAGGITRAWDAEGNSVGDKDIAKLNAEALTTKGIETGKTLYKTPDGSVYSFSTMPGRPGGIWTNMTSGAVSQTAPQGVTPFGQQDPVVLAGLRSKSAIEKQLRSENTKMEAQGVAPKWSEEQILSAGNNAFKSSTGYNYNVKVHGASAEQAGTGYETPPGAKPEVSAVEQNQANVSAAGFSPDLQKKIISAQRSWEEQNALYQQSVANKTPGVLPNGNPVSEPGKSAHEIGAALDIKGPLTRAEREELFDKGYYQPLANDPNHWELRNKSTKPAATGAVSADIDRQARAIVNGEAPMPTGLGAANYRNRAVVDRVFQLDPSYNANDYKQKNDTKKDFTTGKSSQQVLGHVTAAGGFDLLEKAYAAQKNGDYPLFNKYANMYKTQTGQTAPIDAQTGAAILAPEVIKSIIPGGGALADRMEARHLLNTNLSPDQFKTAMKMIKDFQGESLVALQNKWTSSKLPADQFRNQILGGSPAAQSLLDQAKGTQAGTAAEPQTPAEKARAEIEKRRKAQQ